MSQVHRRLLKDCLTGKPGAWEAFVSAFSPYLAEVCRRALARLGRPSGPQETDDLLQEVFLLLLEDDLKVLRAYGGRSSLASYLAVVAAHRAAREDGRPLSEPLPERISGIPGPAEAMAAKEGQERIKAEMDKLSPQARLALALQADGMGQREIGRILAISENAAAHLVSRARATLRERLGKS